MRSLLFVAGLLAAQFVMAQQNKVDYENDIKKADPIFKRTLPYNMDGKKDAALLLENIQGDLKKLQFFIKDSETPLAEPEVTVGKNNIKVDLAQFQDEEKHLLQLKIKTSTTPKLIAEFLLEPGNEVPKVNLQSSGDEPEARADYWMRIEDSANNIKIDLKQLYLTDRDKCCDTCTSCESTALRAADRIIYDALTGITYFSAAEYDTRNICAGCVVPTAASNAQCYKVDSRHVIKLKANDPFIFQVKNVNPELYDVELADTSFLFFNESNAMLEKMLLGKSEGIDLHGKGATKDNNERYLDVRAGLVLLDAEMEGLLENLRMHSRFLYNCVTHRKHQALTIIDTFVQSTLGLHKYGNISFNGFVNIFLDPMSKQDSSLNRRLKMHYLALQLSKYELAYRFSRAPEHDQINFTLSINRKPNSPYPSLLTPKSPTQVAYVRSFFKVDVSSGLYYTNFRHENYAIRADSVKVTRTGGVEDSTGNRLVKENNGRGEIGFASFIHFYQKWGTTVNIGGVLGAGISFEDKPQARYFTGLSLMVGRNNRLCINGGWVWGNQQKLSAQYTKNANGSYNWIPAGESEPKYIKKFQARGFISLSYNLPFLKRSTANVQPEPKAAAAETQDGK